MTVQTQEKWKGAAQHYGRHLLAVFVAVLLVHNVFGAHGFLAMHQKQKEIEKVKTQIERLNKENAALEGNVKDLKTDPQTIEKIAREELGQARPGEVIIKLPAAANESGTAAKTQ
jgi:cell division protein FtsL